MTLRAILIGLLLGLAIASLGYLNDWVLDQAYVASDLLPISVYGLLILGLLIANPLLRAIRARHFSGREWCVIVALMLVACVVPGPGMMWTFSQTLALPRRHESITPGWQNKRVLEYAPDVMLVDPGDQYPIVVEGLAKGLKRQRDPLLRLHQVPWRPWIRPLAFWVPMFGLSFVAGICLVLIVHRQWAYRERLRYPVAAFTAELLPSETDGALAGIFRKRRFWMGFVPALAILLINGYKVWNPQSIEIPMRLELAAMGDKWPILREVPAWWQLLTPHIYFIAIGLAYFVSSDVSLSLGISHIVYVAVFLFAVNAAGVNMQEVPLRGGVPMFARFGAFVGAGLMIFYAGRRYYTGLLGRAFGLGGGGERSVVWACRAAILAATGMVLILHLAAGLDLLLAVLFVLITGLMFLVITRINVETGLILVQPNWHAFTVLAGLFGMAALGPHAVITLALLAAVMTIDPRICLMPLAANGLRFSEAHGIAPRRLARWMIVAVLLALLVGVPATLYVQYNFGAVDEQMRWHTMPGQFAFNLLERHLADHPADPQQRQPLRLGQIRPDRAFLYSAAVGLVLVLLFSALRLRYHWWPIHPVLFLICGTYVSGYWWLGFLLGWAVKSVVTRFGGNASYQRNKPLLIGLVAGEILAGILWSIIGLVYYVNTGKVGKIFRVHN